MCYAQQVSLLPSSLLCNPAGPRAAHSLHLAATAKAAAAKAAASRAGPQLVVSGMSIRQDRPQTLCWKRLRPCRQAPCGGGRGVSKQDRAPPGGERRVNLHRVPIADGPLLGLGHGLQLVAGALCLQHYVCLSPQLVNGLQQLRLLQKCTAKSRTVQECRLPGKGCQSSRSTATALLCSALLGLAASTWHTQGMQQPDCSTDLVQQLLQLSVLLLQTQACTFDALRL